MLAAVTLGSDNVTELERRGRFFEAAPSFALADYIAVGFDGGPSFNCTTADFPYSSSQTDTLPAPQPLKADPPSFAEPADSSTSSLPKSSSPSELFASPTLASSESSEQYWRYRSLQEKDMAFAEEFLAPSAVKVDLWSLLRVLSGECFDEVACAARVVELAGQISESGRESLFESFRQGYGSKEGCSDTTWLTRMLELVSILLNRRLAQLNVLTTRRPLHRSALVNLLSTSTVTRTRAFPAPLDHQRVVFSMLASLSVGKPQRTPSSSS